MTLKDIGASVFLLTLFGLIPAMFIGAAVGLFWIAFWSDWHWSIRVVAGVAGFPLFSMIAETIRRGWINR